MGLQAALLNACAGTRPGARHWARKAIRDHRPHRVRSVQDRHRHDDGGGGRRLAQTGTASTRPRRPRARSSTLRAIAGLVLGALALTAGTSGAAHAQEPPITVRFEKDFHQYGEASRSGRITLEARTAANVAPTENFTLTVFTEDANTEMPVLGTPTALAGSDFTAFRRTYTFRPWEFALEAGQYVVRKLVQLQITDDDVVEKNESFGVVIERTGLPAHVTLHSIKFSAALVIINDEDDTQISASAPRTVTEGESYDYVLTVDKEVAFPFQVVISTVDMTASPTEGDYVHFTNVFEFEPYQRRLVRRVRTRADTRIESNEQLGVKVVGNGLDASIHLPDDPTTVTTIIDATRPDWTVTHTPAQGATTTVREDRGSWRMTVDTGGVTWPTDQTIRLGLTTAAATSDGCTAGAVHGEDFEVSDDSGLTGHASDTLILRAGRTRVTATFAIVDDAHYEPPESVIVTAHHETQRIAAPHVVTILDDQTKAMLQERHRRRANGDPHLRYPDGPAHAPDRSGRRPLRGAAEPAGALLHAVRRRRRAHRRGHRRLDLPRAVRHAREHLRAVGAHRHPDLPPRGAHHHEGVDPLRPVRRLRAARADHREPSMHQQRARATPLRASSPSWTGPPIPEARQRSPRSPSPAERDAKVPTATSRSRCGSTPHRPRPSRSTTRPSLEPPPRARTSPAPAGR